MEKMLNVFFNLFFSKFSSSSDNLTRTLLMMMMMVMMYMCIFFDGQISFYTLIGKMFIISIKSMKEYINFINENYHYCFCGQYQ